jgi:glutathione S-transferase
MTSKLTLVSHVLCPYVQRAAIVLMEKGIAFERIDIDLANKPDWFLRISPLGKTPVLLVDGTPIFESAVICEYLDDIATPMLHPQDALQRAQHRAWIEFGSTILNAIGAFYRAPNEQSLTASAHAIRSRFEQLELVLEAGPYFSGKQFSILDASFGPVFRYFDTFDDIADFGFFDGMPKVQAWRAALRVRASVQNAVRVDYPDLLREFLIKRHSALSVRANSEMSV